MDIAYFPRSKTPISQVADIETENGQSFEKFGKNFINQDLFGYIDTF